MTRDHIESCGLGGPTVSTRSIVTPPTFNSSNTTSYRSSSAFMEPSLSTRYAHELSPHGSGLKVEHKAEGRLLLLIHSLVGAFDYVLF